MILGFRRTETGIFDSGANPVARLFNSFIWQTHQCKSKKCPARNICLDGYWCHGEKIGLRAVDFGKTHPLFHVFTASVSRGVGFKSSRVYFFIADLAEAISAAARSEERRVG